MPSRQEFVLETHLVCIYLSVCLSALAFGLLSGSPLELASFLDLTNLVKDHQPTLGYLFSGQVLNTLA